MDEGAHQTVLSAVLAVVGGAGYDDVAVFDSDFDVGVNGLFEFALGAFYCYGVAINLDGDAGGNCYGSFANCL